MVNRTSRIVGLVLVISLIWVVLSCENQDKKRDYYYIPDGSECVEIVNSDSLAARFNYMFRELIDNHPVLVALNHITVLDDTLYSPVPLPFELECSDIHWADGQCFFSADSTIYFSENNGKVHPVIKTNRIIQSFIIADESILFPDDSLLIEHEFRAQDVDCLINAHGIITDLYYFDDAIFYSTGSDIVMLFENKAYRIINVQEEISSFVVHPNGSLFIGTASGLSYVNPDYNLIDITDKPVYDLELIGDDLFIIFDDNSSIKITNSSNYQEIIDNSKLSNSINMT